MKEIEDVNHQMVYHLIRRKTFDSARYKKKWIVIVDGIQTYWARDTRHACSWNASALKNHYLIYQIMILSGSCTNAFP